MTQKIVIQHHPTAKKVFLLPFLLFFVWVLLSNSKVFSQDSIPDKKDLTEEKRIKFQEFFFKALSEKSIEFEFNSKFIKLKIIAIMKKDPTKLMKFKLYLFAINFNELIE